MSDYKAPAGWKLVPVEPTPEMIEAGAQRLVSWEDGCVWPDSWSHLQVAAARNEADRVWRSMWLTAAPTPPVADACSGCGDEIHPNYSCSDAQALRSPSLRMPEPMTDAEMMRALGNLTGLDTYDVWRRAEAEVMRRVKEANK